MNDTITSPPAAGDYYATPRKYSRVAGFSFGYIPEDVTATWYFESLAAGVDFKAWADDQLARKAKP